MQNPADAEYADMPQSALEAVHSADILRAADVAAALLRLQLRLQRDEEPFDVPDHVQIESGMAAGCNLARHRKPVGRDEQCHLSRLRWRALAEPDRDPLRFRCHTGHAFTADVLAAAQTEKIEEAMLTAMRALREKADTLRRLEKQAAEEQSRRR